MGTRGDFDRLFTEHGDRLLRYAVRRVGRDDAPDVVAEVFLVVWRRVDDLPDPPDGWLYGTAARVIANHQRGDGRRRRLRTRLRGEPGRMLVGAAPEAESLSRDSAIEALHRLTAPDRELLMLVAWDGASPEVAAAALDISIPTLRVRLHRARKRLEEALSSPGDAGAAAATAREGSTP